MKQEQTPRPGSENRPGARAKKIIDSKAIREALEQQLGQQLKSAYTVEREFYEQQRDRTRKRGYKPNKNWDGVAKDDYDPESTGRDNIWIKTAVHLHSRGIDPADFVRLVFSAINDKVDAPPLPNQLLSPKTFAKYTKGARTLPLEVAGAFETQRALAKSRVCVKVRLCQKSTADAVEEVLYDETLALSALFRYCLAVSMKGKGKQFEDAANSFKERAALQYVRHKAQYDESWTCIPPKFKAEASRSFEGSVS